MRFVIRKPMPKGMDVEPPQHKDDFLTVVNRCGDPVWIRAGQHTNLSLPHDHEAHFSALPYPPEGYIYGLTALTACQARSVVPTKMPRKSFRFEIAAVGIIAAVGMTLVALAFYLH